MRRSLKLVSVAIIVFGMFYVLIVGHFRAQARDGVDKTQILEKTIYAQRSWNVENKKRISVKSRMIAVLSNFVGSMHHDPAQMAELILSKSEQRNLDPFLILAMIKAESDFNSWAVSNKGAMGLMQIKPDTANFLMPYDDFSGKKSGLRLLDNEVNISLGTQYLAKLIRRFGNVKLALEAYNRGPEGVSRDILEGFHDESAYVGKVISHRNKYKSGLVASKNRERALSS